MSEKQATILLVEDDISLQTGIAELLDISELGYDVDILVASNGLEGLEIMRTITPSLIISDIMMPKMDGYAFLHKVREDSQWVHIPFIFLTAKGKKQDIRTGKRSGAELYLTKPFDSIKLAELVKTQLDRSFQLQQARQTHVQKFKDSVLQLFNHELRTPLTYVLAYYEMLSDSLSVYEDAENVGAYLRGIQTGCDRLAQLVDDLILVMDIRTGAVEKIFQQEAAQVTDVGVLLREAAAVATAEGAAKRIVIHDEIEADLPAVWGVSRQLATAFQHLLDNAVKFTLPKQQRDPQIWLRATADEEQIHLRITDNGVGLPPHVHRQIFDLFYQYDREHYEQQGAGAGLTIVRGLLHLHGGHVELESSENEGSTFHVYLPVSATTTAVHPEHNGQLANRLIEANVLVVEDDYYLLDGLRELLELYDGPYELSVQTAMDGMEALDLIRQKRPDLIVSDIMMPKLDGYGLLKEVRQNPEWTHIPVIFLTAKGDPKDIHRGLSSGVEEYIPKPYDGDELMDMVTTQLNRHFQRLEATAEDFELLKQSILNLLQTDFRTPLDSVSTYSSTLSSKLEEAQTTNELKRSLEGIQKGSLRISELVEDFITLAEVKTGEAQHALALRGTPMPNVGLLLQQATQTEEIRLKTEHLNLEMAVNQPLPPVWIDYERLQIAFVRLLNVATNLCKYGHGSTIWLTAVADETHVHLKVRHDSHALEPDLVALIEKLFAEDDEQIIEQTSFGAALCLVNGVVNVHHGRVHLDTTHQPHDTFVVTLPIYKPDDTPHHNNEEDDLLLL